MASKSPSYILLRGTQYLKRSANDTSLNPTTALTVSVTIDPEAFGTVQDGTIAGKFRSDNNQRGWKVEYISASGLAKFTVFGAGDGSIYLARQNATAFYTRTNVTFVLSSGAISCYLNGATDNGTATSAGSWTTAYASTEVFAMGADGSSNGGGAANLWKGTISMVAVLTYGASSGDVSGQDASGSLNATLAGQASLQAYWRAQDITSDSSNNYATWVDNKSSLGLTEVINSGVLKVKAQQDTGTAILAMNQWDANLSDVALGSQGLTSTYTLSSPYRLWGSGLQEPQIASGYRSKRGDFTIVIRARKVTGRTTANIFRKRGIFMQYVLSSKEMYCIVGDDNVGSTNKRISWGFNLFPVEGLDAVYVLRHNAVEKDVDLFINQVKYTQVTNVSSSSNETTTGFFVAESCDWLSALVTPACLSDAQVDAFVLGLSQNAYGYSALQYPTYFLNPLNPKVPADLSAEGTLPGYVSVPKWQESPEYSIGAASLTYAASPYLPKNSYGNLNYETQVDDFIYTDPNVVISTAVYSGGVVTVTGNAGPIEGEAVRTWAEIEIRAGQFEAVGNVQFPVALKTRQAVSYTFQTSPDFNSAGYTVRIAVQPQKNSRRVYYSSAFTLTATAPTNPNPSVVSATIDSSAVCHATANAGPTNAGSMTVWWEEETSVGSNVYARVSGFQTGQNFAANVNNSTTFSLGTRTGHTGRKIRFVMQQESNPTTFFYSTGYALTDYSYVNPSPSIQSVSLNILRSITATGRGGPTDVGTCSTWWEIAITAGVFTGVADKRTGIDFTSQTDITDTFTVPQNFSLTGKNLYFVIQPDSDPGSVYRSTAYSLTDATPTSPNPTITAANASLTNLLTASASLSTSNAGPATVWWEVEITTNVFTAILGTTANVVLTSPQTYNLSQQLPSRFSLLGKSIRLAVQSTVVQNQIWYSPTFGVTQAVGQNPNTTISSASTSLLGAFSSSATAGVSNLGSVTVWWEVEISTGTFDAILDTQQTVTLSPSVSTPLTASVSLPTGFDVAGKSVRVGVRSNTFPELVYYSSPFTITTASASLPNPVMTVASVSAGGTLTLAGTAGPSNVGPCTVWFETDIQTGQFQGRFAIQTGFDVSSATTINGSVGLPGRLDLTGKFARLAIQPDSRPDVIYYSSILALTVATYVNPAPAVSAASVNTSGVFSATGACGVSDIGLYHYWFECEVTTGHFVAILDKTAGPSMASARQTVTASQTLPSRFDLTGKYVRLAVQQDSRLDNVYYSSLFPVTTTALSPPSMTITSAVVDISFNFTGTCVLGANNLGNVKVWWEVAYTGGGVFTALIDTVTNYTLASIGQSKVTNVALPNRFDLTGKQVRFAISPTAYPEIVYYSSAYNLTVQAIQDPAPHINFLNFDVWRNGTGRMTAGPTNASFCKIWWEIDMLGDGQFIAMYSTQTNVNLFSQQVLNTTFTLPKRTGDVIYNWTGKQARVAVQTNIRPESVYYSNLFSFSIPDPVDPAAYIDSVTADSAYVAHISCHAGPTNLESCVYWFEITIDSEKIVYTDEQTAVDMTAVTFLASSFTIPAGWNLNGKKCKMFVSPVKDRDLVYQSPEFVLAGRYFDHSAIDFGPLPAGPPLAPPLGGTQGLPGPGVWKQRVRDFSK